MQKFQLPHVGQKVYIAPIMLIFMKKLVENENKS